MTYANMPSIKRNNATGEATKLVTNMNYMFRNCTALDKISGLDFSAVTGITNMFQNCKALKELTVMNLGKSTLTTYDLSALVSWGTTANGKQSLLDTLLTNSDPSRAITVKLSSATKEVYDTFTSEQQSAISAKNITITT